MYTYRKLKYRIALHQPLAPPNDTSLRIHTKTIIPTNNEKRSNDQLSILNLIIIKFQTSVLVLISDVANLRDVAVETKPHKVASVTGAGAPVVRNQMHA